jgi:hypothetical protein
MLLLHYHMAHGGEVSESTAMMESFNFRLITCDHSGPQHG